MINYIIYSHTSYLDVLNIQSDHIEKYENTTLFINTNNDDNITQIYDKFKRVIFYNDSQPYAKRLIECIEQIDDKYFLLIHDIDILLSVDEEIILKLYNFMETKCVDRVDLKQAPNLNTNEVIKFGHDTPNDKMIPTLPSEIIDGLYLIKQEIPEDYIYNVNPSIWYRESFLTLLNIFPNKTYRDIEGMDVQRFSTNLLIYKLFTLKPIKCGYFECLDIFKFLHISHSGKLLLLNEKYETEYGQSYVDVSDEYINIINKYNLKVSDKWVN